LLQSSSFTVLTKHGKNSITFNYDFYHKAAMEVKCQMFLNQKSLLNCTNWKKKTTTTCITL